MSFFNDIFNLAFRAGVPYDAEKNEFRVGAAEAARMEFQRQQDEQMNQWINQPMRGFDDPF